MTITRVGSTTQYADGWELAFGGKKKKATSGAKTSPKKKAAKKAVARKTKKKAAKKTARKKTKGGAK